MTFARLSAPLIGALELLVIAWSIPVAIVLIGAPLALTVVFLLWAGRAAAHAF